MALAPSFNCPSFTILPCASKILNLAPVGAVNSTFKISEAGIGKAVFKISKFVLSIELIPALLIKPLNTPLPCVKNICPSYFLPLRYNLPQLKAYGYLLSMSNHHLRLHTVHSLFRRKSLPQD